MQSTPLIAFDQHSATTVAAVLLPGQRTPALHTLASDNRTILRFVKGLQICAKPSASSACNSIDGIVAKLIRSSSTSSCIDSIRTLHGTFGKDTRRHTLSGRSHD
jgi:hypothetical protein